MTNSSGNCPNRERVDGLACLEAGWHVGLVIRRQFMIKRTLFGSYLLMVRYHIPGPAPSMWQWTRWRRARDLEDIAEAVSRLKDE